MQARFQYRVSYRKAWIAKQMAMEQLYGDYDSSYNELQAYELEPHMFRQNMIRLESDMEGQTNTSFRQWLGTMEPWQWAQSFDEGFRYGQMTTNLVEGINAVLLKTRHLPIASVFSATFYRLATLMPRMGQQQVDQIEAGHVFVEHVRDTMVANHRLAKSINVPLTTFELLPDRGLRRNPRGRPQSSRIHNEMDIREKYDGKRCGICRLSGHSRNKCPNRNFHVGQSSGSGRN
ncbi:hypothetical protein GOBAR_DD15979 [Gossypium barbadense]|nr:hypothetical protein GOBAR_DD15979 [Gossypium barbadense]